MSCHRQYNDQSTLKLFRGKKQDTKFYVYCDHGDVKIHTKRRAGNILTSEQWLSLSGGVIGDFFLSTQNCKLDHMLFKLK